MIVVFLVLCGARRWPAPGVFMLRHKGDPGERDKRMARALAIRVGLSVTLFLLILFAYWMGWIQPRGHSRRDLTLPVPERRTPPEVSRRRSHCRSSGHARDAAAAAEA